MPRLIRTPNSLVATFHSVHVPDCGACHTAHLTLDDLEVSFSIGWRSGRRQATLTTGNVALAKWHVGHIDHSPIKQAAKATHLRNNSSSHPACPGLGNLTSGRCPQKAVSHLESSSLRRPVSCLGVVPPSRPHPDPPPPTFLCPPPPPDSKLPSHYSLLLLPAQFKLMAAST